MFNCEFCGKLVDSYKKCKMVVVKQRKVAYPFRARANRFRDALMERTEYKSDAGGEGIQIVKEAKTCGECSQSKNFIPETIEV